MEQKLKDQIKEIVEIVQSVPEALQKSCFELLLTDLLKSRNTSETSPQLNPPPKPNSQTKSPSEQGKFVIPAKVKTFLQRNNVTEEALRQKVLLEDGEVHFVYEPPSIPIAGAQIQWALLLALKTALSGGEFSVDPEEVRSICIEKGAYDRKNFAANFKTNQKYFTSLPTSQGESVRLNKDGEAKLAQILNGNATE